jgi:UDPglucose 6-dehydrogenase
MNEIANLCEKLGANVDAVRHGIGTDNRIGKRFLFPGIGYGGSCFPKDVSALEKMAAQAGYHFKILQSVMDVNTFQKSVLTEKIKTYFNGTLRGKKIAVWGLAFKPNTDDIREAPAIDIIHGLLALDAEVVAFDPQASENMHSVFPTQITYAPDMYEALKDADALMVATEWNVFRSPDFDQMRALMRGHVIFDGRNLYSNEEMQEQKFYYESIGRP